MKENNKKDTFGALVSDLKSSFLNLYHGSGDILKGSVQLVEGLALTVDVVALGLGAIAIMTIGGGIVAPAWAALSKEKNIIDTEREVGALASNSFYARLFGYPLLAISAGTASYLLKNQ
jgi:hypothetical protein